jgi:enamine deaminase RidA (YjgF/YER057c/UK114 family)
MPIRLCIVAILFCCVISVRAQTPEENLAKQGIQLPKVPVPVASYVNIVRTGNLLFLSGKGPSRADGSMMTGKLGRDCSIDSGYYAARLAAIAHLAVLKEALGSLTKVKRIVKVSGMVNCTENFTDQPKVINGYSDLMLQVFGDKGKHARSAVGMNALPFGIPVEVELIVEVED